MTWEYLQKPKNNKKLEPYTVKTESQWLDSSAGYTQMKHELKHWEKVIQVKQRKERQKNEAGE